MKSIILGVLALIPLFMLFGCATDQSSYDNFAEWPGFAEYYADRCKERGKIANQIRQSPYAETTREEKEALYQYCPRIVIPPGGQYPIDFYRDYLPFTVLRKYPGREIIQHRVTREVLQRYQNNTRYYLDFQFDRFIEAGHHRVLEGEDFGNSPPVVYGRVYRELVHFQTESGNEVTLDLSFLKYNIVFPTSGLSARLPLFLRTMLKLFSLDPENWHDLDNFVAVHIVLLNGSQPIAIILAQHNHHRTYLIGKDVVLPHDGRLRFDSSLRSNEIYLASNSDEPILHRTISWSIELKYLLSGEDPPLIRGQDLTYGVNAGGREIEYELQFLSPCDPFYTAKILLGEPRPFFGRYIGRDGPPGADYYQLPELLPLGNILKFYYLEDNNPEDIAVVDKSIDRKKKHIDTERIMSYGGKKFIRDLLVYSVIGIKDKTQLHATDRETGRNFRLCNTLLHPPHRFRYRISRHQPYKKCQPSISKTGYDDGIPLHETLIPRLCNGGCIHAFSLDKLRVFHLGPFMERDLCWSGTEGRYTYPFPLKLVGKCY